METILFPLVGGVLIGLSSSLMFAGLGRITGISGIISSSLEKPHPDHYWRYFFLAGLLLGGFGFQFFFPQFFQYEVDFSSTRAIVAGLLVGFGTRLGSGCTSGHGVCGLPRLAKRSLVATLTFIAMGILTVTLEGWWHSWRSF